MSFATIKINLKVENLNTEYLKFLVVEYTKCFMTLCQETLLKLCLVDISFTTWYSKICGRRTTKRMLFGFSDWFRVV